MWFWLEHRQEGPGENEAGRSAEVGPAGLSEHAGEPDLCPGRGIWVLGRESSDHSCLLCAFNICGLI